MTYQKPPVYVEIPGYKRKGVERLQPINLSAMRLNRPVIIIDEGHRQGTLGKACPELGVWEYEFNQWIGGYLGKGIQEECEVFYTITTPQHPYPDNTAEGRNKSLGSRTSNANTIYDAVVAECKRRKIAVPFILFFSIHANAFSDPSANGFEIFCARAGSMSEKLAKVCEANFKKYCGVGTEIRNRGIKYEPDFAVLKRTKMASILIEHAFYTNPKDAEKLRSIEWRKKFVNAIAQTIADFTGIKITVTEPVVTKPNIVEDTNMNEAKRAIDAIGKNYIVKPADLSDLVTNRTLAEAADDVREAFGIPRQNENLIKSLNESIEKLYGLSSKQLGMKE